MHTAHCLSDFIRNKSTARPIFSNVLIWYSAKKTGFVQLPSLGPQRIKVKVNPE